MTAAKCLDFIPSSTPASPNLHHAVQNYDIHPFCFHAYVKLVTHLYGFIVVHEASLCEQHTAVLSWHTNQPWQHSLHSPTLSRVTLFAYRWHFTKMCLPQTAERGGWNQYSTWRALLAEGTNATFERKKKIRIVIAAQSLICVQYGRVYRERDSPSIECSSFCLFAGMLLQPSRCDPRCSWE